MGPRRSLPRQSGKPRALQPRTVREGVEDAHARDPWRARLPRTRLSGPRHLHGAATARHREPVRLLSRREPLDPEAREQPAVARRGARLAGTASQVRGDSPPFSRTKKGTVPYSRISHAPLRPVASAERDQLL